MAIASSVEFGANLLPADVTNRSSAVRGFRRFATDF
jgi:hypothetical protein